MALRTLADETARGEDIAEESLASELEPHPPPPTSRTPTQRRGFARGRIDGNPTSPEYKSRATISRHGPDQQSRGGGAPFQISLARVMRRITSEKPFGKSSSFELRKEVRMTSIAVKGVRTAERELQRRLLNPQQLARLSRDPIGARIAKAVAVTMSEQVSDEEANWIARIEALRTRLQEDATTLEGLDFGAGSPNSQRSDELMTRGVEWQKTVREVCRASKNRKWGVFLMKLVRVFQPKSAIELGTCLGISGAYQAAGLALDGTGQLTTLEGATSLAERSRRHFADLGLQNVRVVEGPFHTTLEQSLESLGTIDYAFIDGHHDGPATLKYFEQIRPYLTDPALIVFDDIRWSKSMQNAWKRLVAEPNVRVAVDLFQIGVVFLDGSDQRTIVKVAL